MEAFVTQLNIKVILVSPTNHLSLQAECGIKSLSGLLVKHLSTVWSWHSVFPYSMLCYNGYSSPNLNGYSPYELVFGYKITLSHELEIKVDTEEVVHLKITMRSLRRICNMWERDCRNLEVRDLTC